MQVTLWNQFSSNHSANFTVVGKFPSEVEAKIAYEKWLHLFNDVEKYTEEHGWSDGEPTPLEKAYSEQYGLVWGERFNWSAGATDLAQVVGISGHYVMISVFYMTYEKTYLIQKLMTYFHGRTLIQDDQQPSIMMLLTCDAPTTIGAIYLYGTIHQYFTEEILPPWREYTTPDMMEFTQATGIIQRDGIRLNLQICFETPISGLPALLNYLASNGCTNIEYKLIESS